MASKFKSFHKNYIISKRLVRAVCELYPRYIPMTIIRHIAGRLSAFTGIYVSTMILSELAIHSPVRPLIIKSIILLFAACILRLINTFLEKKAEVMREFSYEMMDCKNAEKMMNLDYQDIEGDYLRRLRERIDTDNWWGSSIYGAFINTDYIIYQCINIIVSAAMAVTVISTLFHAESLISAVFLISLALVIVFNTVLQFYYNKKCFVLQDKISSERDNIEDTDLLNEFVNYRCFSDTDIKEAKLYNAEELIYKYLDYGKQFYTDTTNSLAKEEGKYYMTGDVFRIISKCLCYLFITIMAAISGNAVAIGMVIRYVICIDEMTDSFLALLRDIQSFLKTAKRQDSTFEYLDMRGSMYHGKLPVEKRSDNEYEIEFRNVSFKYPGNNEYSIRNLSLKLRIGEKMAIVGKNGSGKTTMIKLLCRLYDPQEGEILLNGINIRKFDYKEYMQLFSIVFQDFSLFDFSIAENVAVSDNYDKERIKECLNLAGFSEYLSKPGHGIDAPCGKKYDENGILLSGGEKQKIAIARALYKDSAFILLDEPTAALDPVAEYEVYSAFNEIAKNKTAVYISHRLSSCRFCNDIIVFDKGKIVQRGNHDSLIKDKDSLYYKLWTAQAKYYSTK